MKELLVLGLVGLTGYLLYENYNLRKSLNGTSAIANAQAAKNSAAQSPSATANMVTAPQVQVVPDVMYQVYDAEHFQKFPW